MDDVLRQILNIARDRGFEEVTVQIRVDGRVDVLATTNGFLRWSVRADLLPGGPLPLPSEVIK